MDNAKHNPAPMMPPANRFLDLMEDTLVGIYQTRVHGEIVFANEALARMLGCRSPAELIGSNAGARYKNPADRTTLLSALQETGRLNQHEIVLLTKDGREIPVLLNATREGDLITGMLQDLSIRKQTEQTLRESEAKYRALYENAPDMYHVLDKNGIIIDCNETEAKLLDFPKEEIIGRPLDEFFTENSRRRFRKDFPRLKEKPLYLKVEREMLRRNGTVIPVSMHISSEFDPDGEFLRTIAIARDITELKLAEASLQRSEEQFRAMAQSVIDAIIHIDEQGNIVYWNPAAEKMFGYAASEIIGRELHMLLAPTRYHGAYRNGFGLFQKTGQGYAVGRTLELTAHRKDNTEFPIEVSFSVIRVNEKFHAVGVVRDITKRKQSEEDLQQSERKYRALFEDSRDAIYLISRDGIFLDVNRAAEELFGYCRDELIGLDVLKLYTDPGQRALFQQKIEKNGAVRDYEVALRRKDGTEVVCLVTASVRTDNDSRILGYQGLLRDITEKRKMEEELLKIRKLESIGILAGGIAHDFNNLLVGIIGHISLLKAQSMPVWLLQEKLAEMEKAALRAKNLTQQLLTFSRGGEPVRKTIAIDRIIVDSATFALHGSNVRCEFILPSDLYPVRIDADQIGQVFQNLVLNAAQAMPQGGVVTITAANSVVQADSALPLDPGDYIFISVQDQGFGIRAELLHKIFDPYFTTKETGSGFGLAITYSIVKKHAGFITAESTPGQGATFRIYLPADAKAVLPLKKTTVLAWSTGQGRILVMDDEQIIRNLVADMLVLAGYRVEVCKEGREAIELYQQALAANDPFAAVIMDLTIPGAMGGIETTAALLAIDPAARVIVSSGYSTAPVMANFREHGFCAVIPKPYSMQELSRVLQDVLTE